MKYGDILEFRKDLYFDGAVQIDWFYDQKKAAKVAENFVFHGKEYSGDDAESTINKRKIDTISFVREIGFKLNDESLNQLTLAIADYGTGKSHLAITLGQLLSGPDYMPATYEAILDNISSIDSSSAEQIRSLCHQRNFVIVLNGMKDFNLNSELLKATKKSLQLYGIDISSLYKINRTLETALAFFERNERQFLNLFEEKAKSFRWRETGNRLLQKIRNSILSDEQALEIINQVYFEVNGHYIQWDEGVSASTLLDVLVNDYCGVDGEFDHVVILFDEFGRYLEYASAVDEAKSGSSALQQIFEASQNAEGVIQVVNFIQSDIKTYLQRVDQTKNISRYIGRYDVSDKYYISSNLETVFANLIQRKDKKAFNEIIINWQKKQEQLWKDIFNQINEWTSTKSVWNNYKLFRKLIVQGIYPMHPLSTFMLTQLSDYLQSRSSLTLVSNYINGMSGYEVDVPILVYPEQLLQGDLYPEMLSAEQQGRQESQHCIRYDNILRKYSDKLSEKSLQVLRANLAIRLMRFRTKNYKDVLNALTVCSGLSLEEVNKELDSLEEEYGILGFDTRANCFDFMEESNGAYDFKNYKKQLLNKAALNFSILNNVAIKELADVQNDQTTNFSVKKWISTNEWSYKQELLLIKDLSEERVHQLVTEWEKATTPTVPKGTIMWLYANKDTDKTYIDRAKQLARFVENKPILLMLLNDADNRLYEHLREYKVLKELPKDIVEKFERHYNEDIIRVERAIADEFADLKKQRLNITKQEIIELKGRLKLSLTAIFEKIYPKALSFKFDGFVTKANNISNKGRTYYCTIIKMLLSNKVNDSMSSSPIEIRNRVIALLSVEAPNSWGCLNEQHNVIPPSRETVKEVYGDIVKVLNDNRSINLQNVFYKYYKPPYGMNDYQILLMLSIICAYMYHSLRIKVNGGVLSPNNWKESVVENGNKIAFDEIKKSTFIVVDTGEITDTYSHLLDEINNNRDLLRVSDLKKKLDIQLAKNDVPEELSAKLSLANRNIADGLQIIENWNNQIQKIEAKTRKSFSGKDVGEALGTILLIRKYSFPEVFVKYDIPDHYHTILNNREKSLIKFVNDNAEFWIKTLRCKTVKSISEYTIRCNRIIKMFNISGFKEYALKVEKQRDLELDAVEIRDELESDINDFLKRTNNASFLTLEQKEMLIEEGREIIDRIKSNPNLYGEKTNDKISEINRATTKLIQDNSYIRSEIKSIWNIVHQAKTLKDIIRLKERIDSLMNKGIPDDEKYALKELEARLEDLIKGIRELSQYTDSRKLLMRKTQELLEYYDNLDLDYDFLTVVKNETQKAISAIDSRERSWINAYMTLGSKSRPEVYRWKETIKTLPDFLSNQTIEEIKKIDAEADQILSDGRIEDVVHYFLQLSQKEKEDCLQKLNQIIKNV